MMKRLIFIITMLMAVTVQAQTACIVVEDSTYNNRGVDSVVANIITEYLGYAIHWHDIDNVKNHQFFDSMKVVIACGSEVAAPSPVGNLDSALAVGIVAIGQSFWSVVNLGTTTSNSNTSNGEFKNLAPTHWITKVFTDTVSMYTYQSINQYGIATPDSISATDIQPLLIGTSYMGDTSRVMAACVESGGDVFYTTGGAVGTDVAADRRVFCGFFQNAANAADSCALWTLMVRSIAWAATDTLNDLMMKHICFSGKREIDWVSFAENSSGTDSIEVYGAYGPGFAVGYDYEEKHSFFKVKNSAMQRKVGGIYRSLDVASAVLRIAYKGFAFDRPDPTTHSMSFTYQPIIRKWQVEFKNCFHSNTCPNACWTYAWMDTAGGGATSYAWGLGGARQYDVDTRDLKYDTLSMSESTPNPSFQSIGLHPDTLGGRMLDTTLNHGWASRVLNYTSDPDPDHGDQGEYLFRNTTDINAITGLTGPAWPRLGITLSSWSTTEPEPTIAIDAGAYDADSIVFTGILGQTIASQTVQVTNSAGGALECLSIADDAAWSTIIADETNTPMSFTMYIPFGSQAVGYRSGTVTVTCADATNSPKTFKIVSLITAATARQAKGAVEIR